MTREEIDVLKELESELQKSFKRYVKLSQNGGLTREQLNKAKKVQKQLYVLSGIIEINETILRDTPED